LIGATIKLTEPTMQTLQRPKIRDQAAEEIKRYIVDRQLAPGDRLPTENQLAEDFGISRLSVREATKALEFLGIVESKTGVGLTVGQIDLGRVTDHLGFHPALHQADPQQLIDCLAAQGSLESRDQRVAESHREPQIKGVTHVRQYFKIGRTDRHHPAAQARGCLRDPRVSDSLACAAGLCGHRHRFDHRQCLRR